jgi:hypothetical protein
VYLCSASRLRNGVEDWKEITPQPLQDAVAALRKSFAQQAFVVRQIMTNGCRPALRQGLGVQCEGVNRLIEQLGFSALGNVDQGKTEPSVFKDYFDLCAHFLAGKLKQAFFELLEIALARPSMINLGPVEWAALQARVMAADNSHEISSWLKSTCGDSLFPSSDDLCWSSWRAPKWLFMEPFGNNPYDRSTIWEKMDESASMRALDRVEDRFNWRLIISLDKAIGQAHVELAKRSMEVMPKAASHDGDSRKGSDPRTRPPKLPGRGQPDVAKRRAIVKNHPNMEGLGLCELFDADKIPLPKRMRETGAWTKAWKTPIHKHALESLISRDRKSK